VQHASAGTQAEFTIQSESPSAGPNEPWKGYEIVEEAERRFIRHAHGSLGRLGAALGLRIDKTTHIGTVWSSPLLALFVAAIPARIADTVHLREKDTVRVVVELGHLVPRDRVSLAFRPDDHRAWFPPKAIRSRRPRIEVDVASRPPPGTAEVSLSLDPWGEIARTTLIVTPPFKVWPFQLALSFIDPENSLLTEGLAQGEGVTFERAIAALFALMNYAPVWWGPQTKKLLSPTEAQPGATPDIYAWNAAKNDLLIVEVTTGVIGSDKVNKLAGRTQKARNRLQDVLGALAPPARAVLATGHQGRDLAPAAAASLQENGAGVLGRDIAMRLLDMIRQGCTIEEVDKIFEGVFPGSHRRKRGGRRTPSR
jgi:hypothetical protein